MDCINQAIDCFDGRTFLSLRSVVLKLEKLRDTISVIEFKSVNRHKLNQLALDLWNLAVRSSNKPDILDSNSKSSLLMAREIAFKSLQRGILKPWDEKTLLLLLEMAIKIGNSYCDQKDEHGTGIYISLAMEIRDELELENINKDNHYPLFDRLLILRFKHEYILKKSEMGCSVIFEQSKKSSFADYLTIVDFNRNSITKKIIELISKFYTKSDECLLLLMDELSLENIESCVPFFEQNPHLKKTSLKGFCIYIKYLIHIKVSDTDLISEFSSSIICNFLHDKKFIQCINYVAEKRGTMLAVHCLEKEKHNASFLLLSILIPDQNIPKSIKLGWLDELFVASCEFTIKEKRALQSLLYRQGENDPAFWEHAIKIGSTLNSEMDIYNNSLIINLLIESGLKVKAPRSYIDSLIEQCQEEDAIIWKFRIDGNSLHILDYINRRESIDESLLIRMIQICINDSDILQLLCHRALSIINNQNNVLSHLDLIEIIIATSKDSSIIIELLDRLKIEDPNGINDRIYKFAWNLAVDSIEKENYQDACNILKRLFSSDSSDIELYLAYLESYLSCKDGHDDINHIQDVLSKCQIKGKRKKEIDFRISRIKLQCLIITNSASVHQIDDRDATEATTIIPIVPVDDTEATTIVEDMNLELFDSSDIEWIISWSIRHDHIDPQIHIALLMDLLGKTADMIRFSFLLRGLLAIAFLHRQNKLLLNIYYQIETKILPSGNGNYPKEELEWLIIAAYNYGIKDRIWLLQALRLCGPEHEYLKEQIESVLNDF